MKIRLFPVIILLLVATSCLNEYLDRAPDAGLTEEEVFSKYQNFTKYFYAVYYGDKFNIKPHYPFFFDQNSKKFTLYALTDMADMSRLMETQKGKQGDGQAIISPVGYNGDQAKVKYSWSCIRVCNMAIKNIDMIQDATYEEKEDLLAQAYFVRAFVHFEIFRLYGTVPYLDYVLGPEDEWDLPRPSAYDMCHKIADDFQNAADHFKNAGKMRRDPVSGPGHLADADQDKPNGVTALAMKGRALLYAASPLNNPEENPELWKEAVEACRVALDAADEYGYELLPWSSYSSNFYGTKYTNEHLWGNSSGTIKYNNSKIQGYLPYCFTNNSFNSGHCPTQNFVDKFETLDGFALNTEEQRRIAEEEGSYQEQNPYNNRDPRLANAVIFNQQTVQGYGNASLYINEDGSLPSESLLKKKEGTSDGVSETFYYEHKRTGNLSAKGEQSVLLTDPIIRLAELYLNFAEAANEAYGPTTAVPGTELTAEKAINIVRERVGMPPVRSEYLSDPDIFRERIKNERTVELCFEGAHYYCDIRRWKDAPQIGRTPLYGMRAIKLDAGVSPDYPTGFRYERFELPSNRQMSWKNDGMYYIQFKREDLLKMKNYVPNQSW